jgi:hypothetical protein
MKHIGRNFIKARTGKGRTIELTLAIILFVTSVDLSAPNKDAVLPRVVHDPKINEEETTLPTAYFPYRPELPPLKSDMRSPYHDIIKTVAYSENFDWVMLTAIVAQESNFDPLAKSWAGAVGLMQILPRYSQISDIDLLYEPEINLREGVRKLKKYLKFYAYMDPVNQWSFALATYNAGVGHIGDARRLTIDANMDPNQWQNVSASLLQLMQKKYYRRSRYGYCNGNETVRYVNAILNRYWDYKKALLMEDRKIRDQFYANWMEFAENHKKLP